MDTSEIATMRYGKSMFARTRNFSNNALWIQRFYSERDVENGLLPHPDLDYFVLVQNAICCNTILYPDQPALKAAGNQTLWEFSTCTVKFPQGSIPVSFSQLIRVYRPGRSWNINILSGRHLFASKIHIYKIYETQRLIYAK